MNNDLGQLREVIDGSDLFISGYQIAHAKTYIKDIPSWVNNRAEIRKTLLRSFPRLATNLRQRARAGRWARVIYLHFNLGYTRKQVAEEIGSTVKKVDLLIERIRLAFRGLRTDTRKPRKLGKRV